MSKGPGHVERTIVEIFKRTKRCEVISTYDLCREVFGRSDIEKKHRVSVLRAMKRISRSGTINIWRIVLKGKQDDVWFNYDERPPVLSKYRSILGPARDDRPKKSIKQKFKHPF